MPRSLASRMIVGAFRIINRFVPWHRLPRPLGVANLWAFREVLREKNLYHTTIPTGIIRPTDDVPDPHLLYQRTADGTYNDLSDPEMGMANTRFGRNVPLGFAHPDEGEKLLTPSPRTISRRLLRREAFQPATTLNLLAAAWIQFQTHDWFSHGDVRMDEPFQIPLSAADPWPEHPMQIHRTAADPTRDEDDRYLPPTFVNPCSQWWDASAIYGSSKETTAQLRAFTDGKLKVVEGRLPLDPKSGMELTGFNSNWWLGLGLLHTVFALEHNAICDRLQRMYPEWTDEQLFQTARLVNGALIAKIHTVEWTTAILSHPTVQTGMWINFWGLAGHRLAPVLGRWGDSEVLGGIPGSPVDHHGVPFSLTEEFVSVYRLHPLIPDEIEFSSLTTGENLHTLPFAEVLGQQANDVFDKHGASIVDVLYTFGTEHPGAVTLHNYPRALQDLVLKDDRFPGGERHLDLAAVDVMRDRERGVPRYNQFRRLIHMPPAASFETLTDNPVWAKELKEVYEGDIERVDLLVGMLAEPRPQGFGFSDTAFRIFILMAARRVKSDRFFTTDYNVRVYSQVGMDWINDNTMATILLRHYPELTASLRQVKNAFAPWDRVN